MYSRNMLRICTQAAENRWKQLLTTRSALIDYFQKLIEYSDDQKFLKLKMRFQITKDTCRNYKYYILRRTHLCQKKLFMELVSSPKKTESTKSGKRILKNKYNHVPCVF